MGKGWRVRPVQNKKKYDENWDRIFGKKEEKHEEDKNINIYNGKRC